MSQDHLARFINPFTLPDPMKIIHFEAKSKIEKFDFDTDILPAKIGLLTTIQFLDELSKLQDYLESKGKTAIIGGQILGCDQTAALEIKDDIDCFLYLGSGRFHPIGITKKTDKPVFTLHPNDQKLQELDQKLVDEYTKRKKGQYAKFLQAKNIGVLMTKKSGQSQVQATIGRILVLEDQFQEKRFYFFLSDTFDFNEIENFPFIDAWLNTMCPRIEEDIRVLNFEDLKDFQE